MKNTKEKKNKKQEKNKKKKKGNREGTKDKKKNEDRRNERTQKKPIQKERQTARNAAKKKKKKKKKGLTMTASPRTSQLVTNTNATRATPCSRGSRDTSRGTTHNESSANISPEMSTLTINELANNCNCRSAAATNDKAAGGPR